MERRNRSKMPTDIQLGKQQLEKQLEVSRVDQHQCHVQPDQNQYEMHHDRVIVPRSGDIASQPEHSSGKGHGRDDAPVSDTRRASEGDPRATMEVLATILENADLRIDEGACPPGIRGRLLHRLRQDGFMDEAGNLNALSTGTSLPLDLPQVQARFRGAGVEGKRASRLFPRPQALEDLQRKLADMVLDEHLDAIAEKLALRAASECLEHCLASSPADQARSAQLLEALLALRQIQSARLKGHLDPATTCRDIASDFPDGVDSTGNKNS